MNGERLAGKPMRVQWAVVRPSSPDQLLNDPRQRVAAVQEPVNTTVCALGFYS